MAGLNKIGVIAEKMRHKATVVKNQAEYVIKSKYTDFKYYLKNIKNVVKEELNYDIGITELLEQQGSYMMDKTKATYRYVSSMAEEEYRHASSFLVQNNSPQNEEL